VARLIHTQLPAPGQGRTTWPEYRLAFDQNISGMMEGLDSW
jgi:hypothetical protein